MKIEFIEKQEAIKRMKELHFGCKDFHICGGVLLELNALESIPPADVRPVVRGRWINKERVGFGSVEAECSNCGRRMIFNNAWICCPWCMADMSGGDADG